MNFSINIPANTLESSPVRTDHVIPMQTIRGLYIDIPEGHKYLARIRILSQGRQIIPEPQSGDQYLRGNNQRVQVVNRIGLEGPPYMLTLEGWNEDDTYPHAFYVVVV